MQPSRLKPITWTVKYSSTPGRGKKPGTVVVDDSDRERLRFSAVAGCRNETELFLALVAAFSASEGIRKDTGVISWVRWPNIVVINNATVATTTASVFREGDSSLVEFRFGINISPTGDPGEGSLYDAIGVNVDASILLEKILESLSWMHAGWSNDMHPRVLQRVKSMTETVGQPVRVSYGGQRASGRAVDIDHSGRLVVLLKDGKHVALEDGSELLGS